MPTVEVIRKLGEGSTATVHLAREPALERLVAIKALKPKYHDNKLAVARFVREAKSAARISHPNVCTVYRVGQTSRGAPYIVMEYVEGRTLDELLAAEGPLAPERAANMLAQMSAALTAAHEKGIVHRDVRPDNVLVERDTNRVALSDFGIAAIHETGLNPGTALTMVGERLGNPDYVSPEQARGEPVTEATDVYSLGLVGVEMLTGSHASATGSSPVAALTPQFPVALRDVLERCLAVEPARRPPASVVAETLARIVADPEGADAMLQPVSSSVIGTALQFLAELRRRRVYRVAAGYLAGTLILLKGLDQVGPALRIPDWGYRAVTAFTLAGFPVAVTMAWMYRFTTRGLTRTRYAGTAGEPRGRFGRVVLPLVGLGTSVGLAALVLWWIFRA